MKKLSALAILIFALLIANSQVLHVFEKSKDIPILLKSAEIDSITTVLNDSTPQQIFYTQDSIYTYNISDVDRISFNLPYAISNFHEIILPKNRWSEFSLEISHHRDFEIINPSWISGGKAFGTGGKTTCSFYSSNRSDIEEERTSYIYFNTAYSSDSVKVTQINKYAFDDSRFFKGWTTHSWQKGTYEITANEPFLFSGLSFSYNGSYECDWINYTISEDKRTMTIEIEENLQDQQRIMGISPVFEPNVSVKDSKCNIAQYKFGVATPDKQKQALIDLYNTMDGANWGNNENWLSDKPLREWGGLEVGLSEDVKTLNITGASGEFPASLATIMDVADRIQISGNWNSGSLTYSIGGKIPKEVTEHPRWNEYIGWEILFANRPCGKGIDMEDINLRMADESVTLINNNSSTSTTTAYEVLSRNKYTLIAISTPTDEMANVYLSYCNKGFGYVCAAQSWLGGKIEDAKITAKEYPLKNIIFSFDSFANGSLGTGLRALGSTFLVDSVGNIIDFESHTFGLPNSYYANRIESILHNLLGEPEPHDPFVTTYYTSTDYSKDGEVLTLQKATVGKGIDLVFMGDAYIDLDMDEGGLYETDMKKSMEYFFEVEPYKSFRDRFNVYAVKVVSPNSHIGDGCKQTINYDNNICFNYASKIDSIDLEHVTIVNVVYNPNVFMYSAYTNMYESGASVAHIEIGGPGRVIVHEAGGHGFAKLLDEYIYSGYEGNYCPPENLESFKQWIKTDYHDRGWGMNIDTTNDPDSVVWSHFLKDTRYTGEVGIYQGAWYWPTDLWRASENSVMNSDYSTFNAPSREAIYKCIMQLSEGDDWVYDYETFIKWDKKNRSSNIVIDGISYKIIDNDKVKIVGNDGSLSGEVVVKSSITDYDGTTYNVTEIGTRAFADCPNLTVLDIHENIELFEEGYLEGNRQNLTIIMHSTNPPQFADPYYGFKKNNWTLKIPMSAYDLYEAMGWTGELQVVDISNSGGNSGSETPNTPNDPNLIVIDGISYKIIDNGNVRIVGNNGSLSGVVNVKSTIVDADGTTYNVTEIGTRAFADCPDLTVLDIHENIELFEKGYLEGNKQNLTIIMRSTNPPQFADPYYGFYKGYWTLKIPMSAYDLYEDKGWTGELQVVEIDADQSTTKMKTALVRPMVDIKPTVRQIKNHRIPKIIKGSPLNPQGEVAIPDFFNKTK